MIKELENNAEKNYPFNLFDALKNGREHIELPREMSDDNERGLLLAISYLKPREKEIVMMRFKEGKTLREIGQVFGFIPERARQILTHIIRTLAGPKYVMMINKGPQGYMEDAIEKRASQKAELLVDKAYKKGYEEGYAAGENMVKEKIPTIISGANIPIEDLDITVRPYNCLKSIGAETVYDILEFTVEDIKNIKNLGKKSSVEIARALQKKGIVSDGWDSLINRV